VWVCRIDKWLLLLIIKLKEQNPAYKSALKEIIFMNFKKNLWLLPFFSFLVGYQIINLFIKDKEFSVPNLIGKNLNEAIRITSEKNLNLRISGEKKDDQLPENIIISQVPNKQRIKSNQSIYVVISKKSPKFLLPDLKEKNLKEIEDIAKQNNLKIKIYYNLSDQPENRCISYIYDKKNIILYISSGNNKPFLFPNFKNRSLKDVVYLLNLNKLNFKVITTNESIYNDNKNYVVVDQKPIAGSILSLDKINIQLLVKELI